ncbi:hypothetical protein [Gordonia malaquae]|uniref:hypothetical protein n=1 Tax=Gordonia malaquae TaxID=410332 RepID=UPI0030173E14
MAKRASQKALFDSYLNSAFENTVHTLTDHGAKDIDASRMASAFHRFVTALGPPFSVRAEAAEFVLDGTASVLSGYDWAEWTSTPGSDLGKEGLRGDALILITAIGEVGPDRESVTRWYREKADYFDDRSYNPGDHVPEVMHRITELAGEAANRPDGELASD